MTSWAHILIYKQQKQKKQTDGLKYVTNKNK